MPTSVIDICNTALLRLGTGEINSLNEKSKEARYCRRFYDKIRRLVLRSHPWNFASKFAMLAPLVSTFSDYTYAYALPADCLRVLEVVDPQGPVLSETEAPRNQIKFVVRGNTLCTNQEDVEIHYISDVTDPNLFDEQFEDAVAHRLAAEMAVPFSGKPSLQKAEYQLYLAVMSEGKTIDASESRVTVEPGQSFVLARM